MCFDLFQVLCTVLNYKWLKSVKIVLFCIGLASSSAHINIPELSPCTSFTVSVFICLFLSSIWYWSHDFETRGSHQHLERIDCTLFELLKGGWQICYVQQSTGDLWFLIPTSAMEVISGRKCGKCLVSSRKLKKHFSSFEYN